MIIQALTTLKPDTIRLYIQDHKKKIAWYYSNLKLAYKKALNKNINFRIRRFTSGCKKAAHPKNY